MESTGTTRSGSTAISSSTLPSPPLSPPPTTSLTTATATANAQAASELRHMTSATGLSLSTSPNRPGRRTSQLLRTGDARLGSPSSIPSSPTSIHSSSSAIFERDIEPLLPPSPPSHPGKPLDPHRIPRAKNTEQLDQAVPSVLDSAAAILTSTPTPSYPLTPNSTNAVSPGGNPASPTGTAGSGMVDPMSQVEVVAPIASPGPSILGGRMGNSGFASPLSLRSRSPSPGPRPESLLFVNAPASATQSLAVPTSPSSTGDPSDPITSTTANPHLPSSTYGAITMGRSTSTASSQFTPSSPPLSSPTSPTSLSSHPPSPSSHHHQPLHHSASQKRLSFMSYSDLLSSTPASTHTLTALTAGQSADSPPPHIPSVSGLNVRSATASIASGSAANSVRGFSMSPPSIGGGPNIVPVGGLTHPGKRDSIALLDNVGGEWEREGLGRSLEERIEGEVVGSSRGGSRVGSPAAGVPAVLPSKA